MAIRHTVRNVAHRFGFDIVRFPLHDPMARTVQLLDHFNVSHVVDVGANDGGFGSGIRQLGFTGVITSFEPLPKPFAAIRRKAARDESWTAHQFAICDTQREVEINVSGNSGLSSSILPMLSTHREVAPQSHYVGSIRAKQERLDALLPKLGMTIDNGGLFLKIDVQGYEGAVLNGASGLFEVDAVIGLQLELSLTPLYEGALTYRQGLDRADSLGFTLMGLDPVMSDPSSGRLLQVDAIFFRT